MESGGPVGTSLNALPFYHVASMNLSRNAGCSLDWTSHSQLDCLRALSSAEFFSAAWDPTQNGGIVWNPIVDGTFLTTYPSTLAAQGKFVHVPIMNGANTDEGASFSLSKVNTSQDIFNSLIYWRDYALSPRTINRLLEPYPNSPATEPPYADVSATVYPNLGLQWRPCHDRPETKNVPRVRQRWY